MDVLTVSSFRPARTRADLALAVGEVPIAGGTWLMSEPQPGTTGFVDLMTMGWPEVELTETGLRIAATCTIATLVAWAQSRPGASASEGWVGGRGPNSEARIANLPPVPADWRALDLVVPAANALLASFKIWNTATVGGNVARSFAAGAMISLAVALDGLAWCWAADGSERRIPVADLVTGNGTNCLADGEIIRAVELPRAALASRALLTKVALAELGRSGAVVTGRVDLDGGVVFGITAATSWPTVLRYPAMPRDGELRGDIEAAPGYYSDPLGSADWRRSVSATLALRLRDDLLADDPRDDRQIGGTP